MNLEFPRNKEEAVRRLAQEDYHAQPDQEFEIYRMEPGDAWGVARCFYEVYGGHYPFDHYYVPEQLLAADRSGDMIGVVARTATGDIIGFGSLFRNFAHNPRLYETGQATVIPAYRSTLAVMCIQDFIFDTLAPTVDVDLIFGEPVCNHLIMQKIASLSGFADTGIELGVMPGETYQKGDGAGGRVSTVLAFKLLRDRPCTVHLPVEYEAVLKGIISRIPLARQVAVSQVPASQSASSTMEVRYFDEAQVVRLSLAAFGNDFQVRLSDAEEEARTRGIQVFQVFVNLGDPGAGRAVTSLRNQGFFFGGFLPQWFGTDGLLMQKLADLPAFSSVKLLSEESRKLLDVIRDDIENPSGSVI